MRNLFLLLSLIGIGGIVLGTLTVLRAAPGQAGTLPFSVESAGGPGAILGGLILIAGSLYLRSIWQERE